MPQRTQVLPGLSVDRLKIKLASLSILFLITGTLSCLLFLIAMGFVAVGRVTFETVNDTRVSYATLDQITSVSLGTCLLLGLLAFLLMAWGAIRYESAQRFFTKSRARRLRKAAQAQSARDSNITAGQVREAFDLFLRS